ncbi:SDR family NAD(P)-dependent oxidoreductase [Streptomyces sp. NPDC001508]|uniref:SDR family NAD(P)-dependent oxidoreductase n=1 Tax=Streptomyces sp. NPDC001508 TaxID=3154656 RepID=UPI003332FC21
MSVWFVTGASRGLGAEITREALDRGHSVIATARDVSAVLRAYPEKPDGLLAVNADVTDPAQLTAAVEAGLAEFGRIDTVVNNAGYGLVGAIEEVSDKAVRDLFDVNVFGALNTLRATLPTLRAQRSGHVLNIGSVGGFATAPRAPYGRQPVRARTALVRRFDASLGGLRGVSPADFTTLPRPGQAPGGRMRRADLAEALGPPASGVARGPAPLERIGLVTRETDANDGPMAYAAPTDTGRAGMTDMLATAERIAAEIFAAPPWSKEDIGRLSSLLTRLGGTGLPEHTALRQSVRGSATAHSIALGVRD